MDADAIYAILGKIKIPLASVTSPLSETVIVQEPPAGADAASRIKRIARKIPADLAIIGDILPPPGPLRE
ncbi:MAG TPA: hypothetical protein PKV33_05185 [Methanothrix sp.]|nr:hypothetical protein [Methanothrix sp.]